MSHLSELDAWRQSKRHLRSYLWRNSGVEVEEFGNSKCAGLTTIVDLPNGIPSHHSFGCVFAHIDPSQCQHGFLPWVQALQRVRTDVIAIDGKTHRGSHDRPMANLLFTPRSDRRL